MDATESMEGRAEGRPKVCDGEDSIPGWTE